MSELYDYILFFACIRLCNLRGKKLLECFFPFFFVIPLHFFRFSFFKEMLSVKELVILKRKYISLKVPLLPYILWKALWFNYGEGVVVTGKQWKILTKGIFLFGENFVGKETFSK